MAGYGYSTSWRRADGARRRAAGAPTVRPAAGNRGRPSILPFSRPAIWRMKPAMVDTAFRTGIRVHADGAHCPAVPSTDLRLGAPTTTTKKLGKTTR